MIVLPLAMGIAAFGAQELPPIPDDLANIAAVACVKLNDAGAVTGAHIVRSTGDAARDAEVVAWVRKLRWNPAKPGERRNLWFPMPVSFGDVAALPMPKSCAAATDKPK